MNNIIRAYYFLFHVGLGCIGAFLPAYLESEGFSGSEITNFTSLGALCAVFGVSLFWGWLANRLQKPQLVLKILAFGTFAGCVPLLFLDGYWPMLAAFFIYSVSSIGVMGILDAVASTRAKEHGVDFGRMRLFAPAGWMVGSVCLGYYIDKTGKSWNDISVIIAMVSSFGFMFLCSLGLKQTSIGNQERPHLTEVVALFKNKFIVLFLIMATINIMGIVAYWVFFGPLIKSLNMSPWVLGVSIAVGTFSEVVFIFFFDKLKKWFGLELLMIFSIVVSIFRWYVIANTESEMVLILIQLLHSEIALFTVACVSFVTDNVPKKLVITGQTIFYTMTYGVGAFFGNKLMGWLYDYYRGPIPEGANIPASHADIAQLFIVSCYIHIIPLLITLYMYFAKRKIRQGMGTVKL